MSKQKTSWQDTVSDWLVSIIVAVALAFCIRTFIVEPYINKFTYFVSYPQKGEIIVFRYPKDESRDFIKRVIATAGDTVEMRSGKVLVNGTEIDEPYTWKEDPKGPNLSDYRKSVVPEGHIFVLGDNRNNSEDSRFADVGFVPLDLVKGKASLAFWPVDRWRMLP